MNSDEYLGETKFSVSEVNNLNKSEVNNRFDDSSRC